MTQTDLYEVVGTVAWVITTIAVRVAFFTALVVAPLYGLWNLIS